MSLRDNVAKALCKRVLAQASFGDLRVHVHSSTTGNLRFGASQPTTQGDVDRLEISVTASQGGRQATVSGNGTSDAAIRELVQSAEALAAVAPVDPEFVGPLGPAKLPAIKARDPKVVAMDGGGRADLVATVIAGARARSLEASGLLEHREQTDAFADRAGRLVSHTSTEVSLVCTCRTTDGTGSSQGGFRSHSLAGLDPKALVQRVADTALQSRAPQPLAPGDYTVVFGPEAVAQLLLFLMWAMDARPAAEGRSFFARPEGRTALGEALFAPGVTIWSDPADKNHPASPLADDGRIQERVVWVDKGVVKALHSSRNWAAVAGVPDVPPPTSLHMEGTDVDVAALIGKVERGLFVTRLWYNRVVDPQRILYTGLTRDGTFLIENGRLGPPVNNLRYNDGPVRLLQHPLALGRPQRAALVEGVVAVVPPAVVQGFHFSSTSDAV